MKRVKALLLLSAMVYIGIGCKKKPNAIIDTGPAFDSVFPSLNGLNYHGLYQDMSYGYFASINKDGKMTITGGGSTNAGGGEFQLVLLPDHIRRDTATPYIHIGDTLTGWSCPLNIVSYANRKDTVGTATLGIWQHSGKRSYYKLAIQSGNASIGYAQSGTYIDSVYN